MSIDLRGIGQERRRAEALRVYARMTALLSDAELDLIADGMKYMSHDAIYAELKSIAGDEHGRISAALASGAADHRAGINEGLVSSKRLAFLIIAGAIYLTTKGGHIHRGDVVDALTTGGMPKADAERVADALGMKSGVGSTIEEFVHELIGPIWDRISSGAQQAAPYLPIIGGLITKHPGGAAGGEVLRQLIEGASKAIGGGTGPNLPLLGGPGSPPPNPTDVPGVLAPGSE